MNLPRLTIIKRELLDDPTTVVIESHRLVGLQRLASGDSDDSKILTLPYVAIRTTGEFIGKGLYLSDEYEWVLGLDAAGSSVLVPLKK